MASQHLSNSSTSDSSISDDCTPCPHCDRVFKRKGLKRHITSAHPDVHRQGFITDLDPNSSNFNGDFDEDRDSEVLSLNTEFESLIQKFNNLLSLNAPSHERFEQLSNEYSNTLRKCEEALPGPKNPAQKFYELRKKSKVFKNVDAGYNSSSNPQRKSNRKRKARKEEYKESMVQYLFYNQRRKAVRMILNSNDKCCTIPLADLEHDFTTRWGTSNNSVGPVYNAVTEEKQNEIDAEYNFTVSHEKVRAQIKRMNVDSAPGPDGILVRWVKSTLKKSKVLLSQMLCYMLTNNYVPSFMREARTVLIYKSGDDKDSKNWRPITVSSVLRRIVEKVLDSDFRECFALNGNQRGFTNQAGTLINATLVNECLKKAKREKLDCTIIFGDITQAFDSVGHAHVFNQIKSKPAPSALKNLVCNLASKNFTRITTIEGKSNLIQFQRGVMQGSPISPFLFNVAIDPMVQDLSEKEVTDKFGFSLHSLHDKVSNAEFADDTGMFGNSRHAAVELYQQSTESLARIGLHMNPLKSAAISIVKGELCQDPLQVGTDSYINCIGPEETIKYLGVTFNDCIVFDEAKVAKKFGEKIEKLTSTPMLRPDQKLKVLKDYLWPTLIYPFQMAPLSKLSKKFLESIDKIIRSCVKEVISLPISTPTSMLYSSSKCKGLGLIRAKWEAGIQNFNALEILSLSSHALIHEVKDLDSEKSQCLDFLDVPFEVRQNMVHYKGKKSKFIRDHLRSLEYDTWCKLPQKGQGVIQFQECPYANKWIHSKIGLSSSEWTTAIKMVGNVLPVNAIPRPDQGSLYCRHGCKEIETIGHILGRCHRGELIRNNRHHAVRCLIAEAMQKLGWKVLQEAECTGDGSRRVDIIAYNLKTKQGIILDPTVRMEQNDINQSEAIHKEKKEIYDPCIPYFKQKLGLTEIHVVGLYVGARGTISKFFLNFMKTQCLPSTLIDDIVISVLKKSVQICVHHLYSCIPTD